MSYKYPYKSQLKKELAKANAGIDYFVWDAGELKNLLAQAHKPIVEIGGPTFDGYYFLDTVPLTSKPVITNISKNPLPYSAKAKLAAKKVNTIVDATNMPYKDASIIMFLMKCMSISSDWWLDLPEEQKDAASATYNKEYSYARLEMAQVAAGTLSPQKVTYAQRVKIFLEAKRCLVNDGLFFTDGTIEDIVILQKLGFTLITYVQFIENNCSSYEFVMKKTT